MILTVKIRQATLFFFVTIKSSYVIHNSLFFLYYYTILYYYYIIIFLYLYITPTPYCSLVYILVYSYHIVVQLVYFVILYTRLGVDIEQWHMIKVSTSTCGTQPATTYKINSQDTSNMSSNIS